MVKRVLVMGGGTAGFLAAISVKVKLPHLEVTVLRSKEIGIIGVGEGSTLHLPNYLHGDLKIPPGDFMRKARPTYKLGMRLFWGPRPSFHYPFRGQFAGRYSALGLPLDNGFYCDETMDYCSIDEGLMTHDRIFERQPGGLPLLPPAANFAYHIENFYFVEYLESYALSVGVVIVEDTVASVEQNEGGVSGLVCKSGRRCDGDMYVDASGFASVLLGKTFKEPFRSFSRSLYCDQAIIGGWMRAPDEVIKPYTTAETMNAGWCWRIDHEDAINRGYVFSPAFISAEEAEREFREKNPRVVETRLVKFTSGAYERGWVKNVMAIGNAAGFVEPLQATAIGVICRQAGMLAHALANGDTALLPGIGLAYNQWQNILWNGIRNFLAIHYRYNTRLDTPFWRACRNDVDIGEAAKLMAFYHDGGPEVFWMTGFVGGTEVYEIEGYLALLVGMKVPYRARPAISGEERKRWEDWRGRIRTASMNGVSVREALDILRRPDVQWGNFFRPMY